jgi:tricorn protease
MAAWHPQRSPPPRPAEESMRKPLLCLMLVLAAPATARAQQDEARLLRFPAIHGNQIVFTYAGNLYTVEAAGGVARKLTNHDGFEMFARFSPDGTRIAFTGQYDGNTEVYVMPAEGGAPKRLTFTATLGRDDVSDRMGPNNIVMAWKDNDTIVFRSRMIEPNDFIGQLFTVSAKGGLHHQLPVPRGGFCSFSPDGKQMAYNRIFREFRTWKRYRGGMADDVWIYDFESKKTAAVAENPACDTFPMWATNGKIYFLSDRDKNQRFNLWSYDTATKKVEQHTKFKDWDCKFPSLGDKAIVFENAGYIYRFDLTTEKAAKVPVRILEDFLGGRKVHKDVSKSVASYEVSSDGKRALFSARGDLFTVPAKDGPTRNLTQTSGVHERNPKWSPDGKWIAYVGDASGEDEIHIVSQDGSGAPQQITSGPPCYKYEIRWSPDSKKILWADKQMRLFYVDVGTKKSTLVDQAKYWEIHQYEWSPDSKWISYAKQEKSGLQSVYLYSVDQAKSIAATEPWHDSYSPAFSRDGKYLFFVSERDFNPIYSGTEWNHAYADMARVYLLTLAKDTPSPFRPRSDEVETGQKETPKDKPKEGAPIQVDIDGIQDRVVQLPVQAATYRNLQSAGNSVYYIRRSRKDGSAVFLMYDLVNQKETQLGTNVSGYEISGNGQKMIISQSGGYAIIDLPKAPILVGDYLNLSDMKVYLDRQLEWKQIFRECWRQMRDFFYDPDMHGVDWKGTRDRFEQLLPYVNHRADLTYIIGEMISELNCSHAYVGGGDSPKLAKIQTGLLGAQLRQDEKTRYYQITKILKGSSWDKELRAPLAELGVNVKVGDWIVAIDGRPTNEMTNIYEALVGKVDRQVRLKINSEPAEKGSREIVIVPIADEQPLYYHDMVQRNIKYVSDKTKGEVGYLHVPDMLATGLNEFAKYYYPQLRKKALIIDVRGNGGGNVSPMLIERLRREIAMIHLSRDTAPYPDPSGMLVGPKVCLMNEFSASDGDLFPYRFRHYKLGKLIGKRSWGGTVGIRGPLPLVDGGGLYKPEFASYEVNGKKWVIEGQGVDPDIVVDNDPAREFAGIDEQLDRAIEVILEELRNNPGDLPGPPPYPKR